MCTLSRLLPFGLACLLFLSPGYARAGEEATLVFYTGVQSPIREILDRRLAEAFRRIGKKNRMEFTGSSQRALVMANTVGDGDALRVPEIKRIAPENTANLQIVPESVIEIAFFVYTKDRGFRVSGWDSLKDLNNGFRIGTKILEKNIPGNTTRLPDSTRLFKMLNQNRLDTVTEHGIIADAHIRRLGLNSIVKLTPPLVAFPGFCFIHKKHGALIPKLAEALASMKKDGSFSEIMDTVMAQQDRE